jgi:ATP-binding protein involved in chromosome partitioning
MRMSDDPADRVRAALATVMDPDLGRDLVGLNMIREVRVEGGVAAFRLVLTTAACPARQQLEDQCRAATLGVDGIERVEIAVSAEVPRGVSMGEILPGVRHVIGIGAGKGGVGKSTVAVNLACALASNGARVGLLDADIYGPSLPLMMGINEPPQVVDKKMVPVRRHGLALISMGFFLDERQPVILRGPLIGRAVQQLVTDVAWGELDYLFIDLPPGTGDVPLTLAQTVPLAGVVVVSTPQAVALADVRRSVAMFGKVGVEVFGIVENMGAFVCPQCGHLEPIFGEGGAEREAAALDLPFLGRIPLEPAVRVCGDEGTPVVLAHPQSLSAIAFRALAEKVAQQASIAALAK